MHPRSPKRRVWIAAAIMIGTIGIGAVGAQPQAGPFASLGAAVAALQNQVSALAAAVAALQNQSGGGVREIWSLGSPPFGGGFAVNYCSFCAPSMANQFDTTAPAARRVDAIHLIVGNRFGSYGSGMFLTIEVRSFDGSSSRTISVQPVDLAASPERQWIQVPIVATADAVVHPGEYLGSRVQLGGSTGGNLNLNVYLRADVVEP